MDKDLQDNEKPEAPRFEIFRGAGARDYNEHNILRFDGMTPAIEEGLSHYLHDADDAHGQIVKMLYGAPGFSLTHVWFKSAYPLPLHSHTSDCLYYIVAGTIKMGTEELGVGDGFFVGANVPYTYTPGPDGVEVLEFRNTDALDIRFMSRNKATWEKAGGKIAAMREKWKAERPPSESGDR